MQKITTLIIAAVLLLTGPALASAQTATTTTSATVAALLAQLEALKTQLEALKAAQQKANEAAQELQGTFALIKELRQGMTSDDIAALQALLAADPSIYPEGIISGYYGHLTAKAVKRFQKKFGIEQVGNVGPKTLKKMNEFLKEHPITLEDADDDDDGDDNRGKGKKKRPCAIVPPGHLIASGWLKKHDGVRPIVPPCQTLPHGIVKKLTATSTATTTPPVSVPDTTAPAITAVSATNLSATGVTVIWTTDEAASSKVYYGTTDPVPTSGTTTSVGNTAFVTSHSTSLTGLTPATTYYYVVSSADAVGNTAMSSQGSFATLAVADTTAPAITAVSAGNIASTSANVIWTTDEQATGKAYVSVTNPVPTDGTAMTATHTTLVTAHDLLFSGLTASSTYYYFVTSTDTAGNTATSSQNSFVTLQ